MIEIFSAVSDVTFQFNYKSPYPHIYQSEAEVFMGPRCPEAEVTVGPRCLEPKCLGPRYLGPTGFGADLSRGRGGSGAEVSGNPVST